jgi:pimeloyl-ACP methyl ester carboxylesterase
MPSGVSDSSVTSLARPQAVVYLHGFASSPASTKAAYFAECLRLHGVPFVAPDLNLPDFRTLTMTRMLTQAKACLEPVAPAVVVGSSLGGALAILIAARMPALVDRLILLAPAVMIARPGHHLLPQAELDEWRQEGVRRFFHYAAGEERLLNYDFYLDTLEYDPCDATFSQPTLIFQGVRDETVDAHAVEAFARERENVRLKLLDDDHQLASSLPAIWADVEDFLFGKSERIRGESRE